jgi:hypothetical protein
VQELFLTTEELHALLSDPIKLGSNSIGTKRAVVDNMGPEHHVHAHTETETVITKADMMALGWKLSHVRWILSQIGAPDDTVAVAKPKRIDEQIDQLVADEQKTTVGVHTTLVAAAQADAEIISEMTVDALCDAVGGTGYTGRDDVVPGLVPNSGDTSSWTLPKPSGVEQQSPDLWSEVERLSQQMSDLRHGVAETQVAVHVAKEDMLATLKDVVSSRLDFPMKEEYRLRVVETDYTLQSQTLEQIQMQLKTIELRTKATAMAIGL